MATYYNIEQRRHKRAPFLNAVSYQFSELEEPRGSAGHDISRSGMRVDLYEFVPIGSMLDLQLNFSEHVGISRLKAKVVWVKDLPDSERFQVGLEFVNCSQKADEFIDYYVQSKKAQSYA